MAWPSSSPGAACAIVSIVVPCLAADCRRIETVSVRWHSCRRDRGSRTGLVFSGGVRLRGEPGGEVSVAHYPDSNGHERMVLAAQFGTLAVEHPLGCRLEPSLINTAGDSIDPDAKRWYVERVNHVGTGDNDVHNLVHRHDHLTIDR